MHGIRIYDNIVYYTIRVSKYIDINEKKLHQFFLLSQQQRYSMKKWLFISKILGSNVIWNFQHNLLESQIIIFLTLLLYEFHFNPCIVYNIICNII